MVKVYLSRKGVPFTELNVSRDVKALKKLVGMGFRTTPVTVIGDEKLIGYSPGKIDAALTAIGLAG